MEQGFWKQFKKPIIGLSPMDGVTDAPFRFITVKYGKPDLVFTEFTSVEGICAGATKTLSAFYYDEIERPIVAQLFGSTPEAYYKAAFVVCELGFDGIDINMGCPAKNISSKGAGAALILTPKLAQEIIIQTKRACIDWANGKSINDIDLHKNIIAWVDKNRPQKLTKKVLPVSVKTRIGYDKIIIEEWVKYLLETEPVNITLHGRTLKQGYSGNADWEAIARAATIIHQTQTSILGNGDIQNIDQAHKHINNFGVDGILIGRAALGNPWIFQNHEATVEERLKVAIEHTLLFAKIFANNYDMGAPIGSSAARAKAKTSLSSGYDEPIGGRSDEDAEGVGRQATIMPMRKHLSWYAKGFEGAAEVRQQLMQAKSAFDVENILRSVIIRGLN